jgi:hypothetical protein
VIEFIHSNRKEITDPNKMLLFNFFLARRITKIGTFFFLSKGLSQKLFD